MNIEIILALLAGGGILGYLIKAIYDKWAGRDMKAAETSAVNVRSHQDLLTYYKETTQTLQQELMKMRSEMGKLREENAYLRQELERLNRKVQSLCDKNANK